MKRIKELLKEEVRKPIWALRSTAVFALQFLAFSILRFVLWSFFFFLPTIAFFLFAFHWTTGKVRGKIEKVRPLAQFESPVHTPVRTSAPNLFELRALSQDLRFWLRELERLKGK